MALLIAFGTGSVQFQRMFRKALGICVIHAVLFFGPMRMIGRDHKGTASGHHEDDRDKILLLSKWRK